LNLIRCFVLPVAYGAFLAVAQVFFNRPNNVRPPIPPVRCFTHLHQYGLGQPVLVGNFTDNFDSSQRLVWADGTDGSSNPSPQAIMDRITSGFSDIQRAAVTKVSSVGDIPLACPQNFNLRSTCYAALAFNDIPSPSQGRPINYTLRADGGLVHIDVVKHTSDYEERLLPLQWAVDKVRLFRHCNDFSTHF
jgi:ATP-binding cassette subfamily A (ABC1) protein 3